jgi:putative membrane protein
MARIFLTFALVVALVPLAVGADDRPTRLAGDADFLVKAISCGTAEMKFSELAEKQASNADVKEFARKIVADHKKGNEKLMGLAREFKVAVLTGLEKEQRDAEARLRRLSGPAFDRAYMQQIVDDHEKAITLFENESKTGTNPQLRKEASNTLSTLREHLKEAKAIQEKLKR